MCESRILLEKDKVFGSGNIIREECEKSFEKDFEIRFERGDE